MNGLLNHINKGGGKTKYKKREKSRRTRKRTKSKLNNVSLYRRKTIFVNRAKKIKYGFLVLTTHGAHNSEFERFQLPFDMVTINAAPIGICNYTEGNKTKCTNNYNLMKKILKNLMKVEKKYPSVINENTFLSHMLSSSKLMNINPSNIAENDRAFRITRHKKYQMYNYKKKDLYLNKYLAYDSANSPNVECNIDNTILFIYMDDSGKIVEEKLNIIMDENEETKSIMLDKLLDHIKKAYNINKLFLFDFSCSTVFKPNSNKSNMVNENQFYNFNNRELRTIIKNDKQLRSLVNKIITPKSSRVTRKNTRTKA